MLIVAGGWTDYTGRVATSEVLALTPLGSWVPGGALPSARTGMRGVTAGGVFYLSGGFTNSSSPPLTSVVSYDPESGGGGRRATWHRAGTSMGGRPCPWRR